MTDNEPHALELPRTRRWPWVVIGGIALIAIGAASAWAVLTVMRPVADPLDTTEHTYVEVVPGEVGATISLNTVAEWTPIPVGANRASGVITAINIHQGEEVTAGTPLYTVDLRPVVIAQGDVPAFRDITPDTEGPDVQQAQSMLAALDLYHGDIDGHSGPGTTWAIKAWQSNLGLEETGVIEVGDIIFVPTLPTRITLDTEIVARGHALTGGEQVLSGLPLTPDFRLPVTDAQAAMIQPGTRIEITSPDGDTWIAHSTDAIPNESSSAISIGLASTDEDGPICADQCAQIASTGTTSLRSRIVTAETIRGLVVPTSALLTTAEGQHAVINDAGERIPVTVETSAKGMSVISGVDEGTKVRVPAKNEPAS